MPAPCCSPPARPQSLREGAALALDTLGSGAAHRAARGPGRDQQWLTCSAEIVARKRTDVAARFAGIGLADLRAQAAPTALSLRAALARPGARFVMEVKKASPSAGALAAADAGAQARAYAGAADAVSVLTDTPFFGGSLDDLRAVRAAYDGPVLAKDFVIDPRQVVEARIAGADAVLAMLSVLGDAEAPAVIAEARTLGMDVLVEAHDEAEVRRAIALGAPLIGINNRDLKTLEVDLAHHRAAGRAGPRRPAGRRRIRDRGPRRRRAARALCRRLPGRLVADARGRAGARRPGASFRPGQGLRSHQRGGCLAWRRAPARIGSGW